MTTDDHTAPLTDLYESGASADIDDSDRDVGRRLAEARRAAGLDAADLATQLGIEPSVVEDWETGRTTPSGHRLARLAGLLGVSLSWLVVGHGTEPVERDQAISELRQAIAMTRAQLNDALADLESRLDVLITD